MAKQRLSAPAVWDAGGGLCDTSGAGRNIHKYLPQPCANISRPYLLPYRNQYSCPPKLVIENVKRPALRTVQVQPRHRTDTTEASLSKPCDN
ncbi:hypothetical protein BaRGS_00002878 [Batillaria attramentaria]|uniref:Uncharacterized protein n=1 Tax=Batillaria attramentaria TaxID=370345 RepID=A0ABD0M1M0_9CAEN